QSLECLLRRFDLRLADSIGRVQDLPLQGRKVDDVGVDYAERPYPRGGEVVRSRRSETARADEQDFAVQQFLLAGLADLGDQKMARISLRLLGREARGLRPRLAPLLPSVQPTAHGDYVVVQSI